ncbi:MAG: hypothetical protein ACO1TE_17400 [Prosthecobacter sp.]
MRHATGHAFVKQVACAQAAVQPCLKLDASSTGVLDVKELFPICAQFLGKTVSQAEGDKLSQAALVAMGQIASFLPAVEACHLLFLGGRGGSVPLTFNYSSHLRTIRQALASMR